MNEPTPEPAPAPPALTYADGWADALAAITAALSASPSGRLQLDRLNRALATAPTPVPTRPERR